MESRAKLAGHAIHPMLIVYPLGLLTTALLFDLIGSGADDHRFHAAGFFMIAAGLTGALLASVFGLIDWMAIPKNTRAKRIGLLHAGANDVMIALFGIAWLLRLDGAMHNATALPLVLEVLAVVVSFGGAWLGGELVERLGIGVDHGAYPDATSSLRGGATPEPAGARPAR